MRIMNLEEFLNKNWILLSNKLFWTGSKCENMLKAKEIIIFLPGDGEKEVFKNVEFQSKIAIND